MKNAIVIGATSGIGNELAKLLASNNYMVGITGRRIGLLEQLKEENPDYYFYRAFDITDTKTSIEKLEELAAELGGLDLIVISSGTGDLNESLEYEIEKRTINTNVLGFTNIADWAFNYFRKQKYGQFAAISSMSGLRGSRHAPSYNASKSYQINYLESLRQKAAFLKLPIFITDIRPGFVDTDMAKGDGKFWVASVEKAARQIFHAINKEKKIVYITKRWRLIAIILKCLPRAIYDKM